MEEERRQILIVDDEEINRELLVNVFKNEYDILKAENGILAIGALEENHNICLILLDIVMPVLDGYGVLEYMEQKNLINKIPVILITSEPPEKSEDRAYSIGIADVIHKPFFPHIVKKRSENIIELYDFKRAMKRTIKEQE